jgi:hypothetical protein
MFPYGLFEFLIGEKGDIRLSTSIVEIKPG